MQSKARSEFYHGKRRCKACFDARRKLQRDNDTRLQPCLQNVMRHTNTRARAIEQRSPDAGVLDFDLKYLTELWERQHGRCALSGLKLTHTSRPTDNHAMNVSLDRVDSACNYTKDNVLLVAMCVNRMKHDLREDEFVRMCRAIVQYHDQKS